MKKAVFAVCILAALVSCKGQSDTQATTTTDTTTVKVVDTTAGTVVDSTKVDSTKVK